MKRKILIVIGTRPDFIKMVPVLRALNDVPEFEVRLVSTGQHKDLTAQVSKVFGIEADVDLKIMTPGQTLAELTSRTLVAMDGLLKTEKPDVVVVHGDTTTCFATALAAFYQRIPVAQVEAGLRSFRLDSPFPEEFNRQSISPWVWLHFAPDERSLDNLVRSGIPEKNIVITGNTGIDAMREVIGEARAVSAINPPVVVTLHRREKDEATLEGVLRGISFAAKKFPHVPFVFPLHPNPVVRDIVKRVTSDQKNIECTDPLPYDHFISLVARSRLVITDSGSLQEEAAILQRQVLLVRDISERTDGINEGFVKLVGTHPCTLASAVIDVLTNKPVCPFGVPAAILERSPARLIANALRERLV